MLLGLNHSITRTHDLRGPFKYGQYGTETASTVVIGDAESVGTQVYRFLLSYPLFVTTSSFISSHQGKSPPSRTPFHAYFYLVGNILLVRLLCLYLYTIVAIG